MIHNNMNTDTTVKTAALAAAGTSNVLNKTNTLKNFAYGDEIDEALQEQYMNKETKTLNKNGRHDLIDLYKKMKNLEMKL